MAIGVIGRKCGMTRVFTEEGVSVPVTVIEVSPNRVSQVKTEESDGYQAVQVTVGERRASRVTKAQAGHFAKAGVEAGRGVWEFRAEAGEFEAGSAVTVEGFEAGQMIDVTGSSKGKGFAGGVKRWNFSTQDATHGNSLSIVLRVLLVRTKPRAACLKARRWPVIWVLSVSLSRTWKWCVSMLTRICCWLKVRSPVLPVVM